MTAMKMFISTIVGFTLCLAVAAVGRKAGKVGFSASIQEEKVIQGGDTVVYDNVQTNQGDAYDSDTGVFTAQKSGLYVFHFHALTSRKKSFIIDLYHNDDYVISAFARQNNDFAHGANTAVLRLKPHDRVYIKAQREVSLFGSPTEVDTTFSGYQI